MKKALSILVAILAVSLLVHLASVSRLSPVAHEFAMEYAQVHRQEIGNQRYVTVIDFTRPSYVKRMFIFDLSMQPIYPTRSAPIRAAAVFF